MQSAGFDAIVVGSGISGGWAAKELTEKGLRVLLLERGRNVEHVKDYVNATKAPWEYPHRGGRTHAMEEAYPVLKRDYPLNEKNLDWWVNEKDSPYTEVKRFDWYRGYHVGGRSLTWGRQSYRWSDFDFEANAKEGIAVDWPIRYADLAPWYDHVERHRGHHRLARGAAAASRRTVSAGDAAQLRRGADRRPPEEAVWRPPPHHHRPHRQPDTGRCRGAHRASIATPAGSAARYGAYFSTQSSTLPAAAATGRLTLKPLSIVTEVLYDKDRKRATGVRVIDAVTEQTTEYTAKVVFLCASTFNSTWLLHALGDATSGPADSAAAPASSVTTSWTTTSGSAPAGQSRAGRQVLLRPPPDRRSTFRAIATSSATSATTCAASATRAARAAHGWSRAVAELGVGAAFKDEMATPGAWSIGATRVRRDAAQSREQDHHRHQRRRTSGACRSSIDCATGENERLMRKDMMNDMAEMLEACRRQERAHLRHRLVPGHGHPRDGHGAHGPRSEDLGPERAQPGVGRAERVRHRRLVHDVDRLPESLAHVHGAHRPRGGFRRERAQAPQPLSRT